MNKPHTNLNNLSTQDLIDALRERADVLALKVWTRQDCEDVARQLVEHRSGDENFSEQRVEKIVEDMMANRYSPILDELRDCNDTEWDTLWRHASDNDPGSDSTDCTDQI